MSTALRRPRAALVPLLALLVGLLGAVSVAWAPPSRAVTLVDVTVTITRFIEVQNPDPGPGQGCCGDYVGEVQIGSNPAQSSAEVSDTRDLSPFWRFTRQVDRDAGPVEITIRVRDVDTALAAPDDLMDLNPLDERRTLSVLFDPVTGSWGGEVPLNTGFSAGDGDTEHTGIFEGGEIGKVFFDIGLGDGDVDDDGIPDGVERFGIRNSNGAVTTDLRALGANPCRKTVAVELDFMEGAADGHTHRPQALAVSESVQAFEDAPVPAGSPCPYPDSSTAEGMDLVLDVGNAIPEQPVMGLDGPFAAARTANFDADRRPYFHYAVAVHDQKAGSSSSGLCCSDTGRDFLLSLGSWRTTCVGAGADGTLQTPAGGDDVVDGTRLDSGPNRTCDSTAVGDDGQSQAVGGGASDYAVGTPRDQSGTVLHELGHAIGLEHGGDTDTNFKPSYLSVMNYAFDPGGIPVPGGSRLDYSREALATVLETGLVEAAGLGSPRQEVTVWRDAAGAWQSARADAATVDWDGDGTISATPLTAPLDLNVDAACTTAGDDGMRQSMPAGDDVISGTAVRDGPDRTCQTAKAGDDEQDRAVGHVQVAALTGYDDWDNLKLQAGFFGVTGGAPHGPDVTFEEAVLTQQAIADALDPDLHQSKTVDRPQAEPGTVLQYALETHNHGPGDATEVVVVDTLPDGTQQTFPLGRVDAQATRAASTTYLVPCDVPDGTVLVNRAAAAGKDLLGDPEEDLSQNVATAQTEVLAPVLELSSSATSVQAGEASTVLLRIVNSGSAALQQAVVTHTLPAGTYYSTALDAGSGPRPDEVVRSGSGTTTLVWQLGTLAPDTTRELGLTVRSSLLLRAGTPVTSGTALDGTFGGSCTLPTVTSSTAGVVLPSTATRNPLSQGYWGNHASSDELRARVQATDQRADTDGNGALSQPEATAAFAGSGLAHGAKAQLLAVLLNLAERRVVADTQIVSATASRLGTADVSAAGRYGQATLAQPHSKATQARYSDTVKLLDEINTGRSPRW